MQKWIPRQREDSSTGLSLQEARTEVVSLEGHFAVFEDLVGLAGRFLQSRDFGASAAVAQMAGEYAWRNHPGLFVSSQLESVLTRIGQVAMPSNSGLWHRHLVNGSPKHVLHVLTQAYSVGGHTRMVWRWINRDSDRVHSVALTRQGDLKVPKPLYDAVSGSAGQIHFLDGRIGGLVSRAKALQRLAVRADLVVLHIHPYDVVPVVALSRREERPPVIFVNHADHVYWLGVSVAHVVAHIRHSGLRLSLDRRGIEKKRGVILPIPLSRMDRELSRPEAKRKLGLSDDTVVLLSAASRYKYKPINSISFIEALLPVIQACDKAVLLVVGPNDQDLQVCVDAETRQRIRLLGSREDTALFYQAADIYLDSFPFASITSLLEAGSFGAPLVSYCAHPESAAVLCADDPGLTQHLICANDIEAYRHALIKLIQDAGSRAYLGEQTQKEIFEIHEAAWPECVEELYAIASRMPARKDQEESVDQMHAEELDLRLVRLQREWGPSCNVETVLRSHYRLFPLRLRFKLRAGMETAPPVCVPDFLVSEWICTSVRKLVSRVPGG